MKTWTLTHSKKGWVVVVYEQSLWRLIVSGLWERLIPSWLCCGTRTYRLANWLHKPLYLDDYRQVPHTDVLVSEEIAEQIRPDFVANVREWDEED